MNWDSYTPQGAFTVDLTVNVLNGLMYADAFESSKIIPELAERWDVSGDGLSVRFFLRKDVKWQDGKDFTAQDVLWNLDRGRKGEGGATYSVNRLSPIAQVEAADNSTIKLTLGRVSASFMANMATPFMQMYAPQGPKPASNEFKAKGIGTGAFKISEWQTGVRYNLVRNDGYWKKDDVGRSLPFLDSVTVFVIVDPATAMASFRAGRLDCGCWYDQDYLTQNKEQLEKDLPGVKLTRRDGSRYLVYVNQRGPFANRDLRRATLIGLDLLSMRNLFRDGKAYYPPSYWAVPELGGGWSLSSDEILRTPGFRVKDGKKDPADLTLAKQLFQQAGVDPASITVNILETTFAKDRGEILATLIHDNNGLGAKLNVLDTASGNQAFSQGQYDVYAISGFAVDDPSDLTPLYVLKGAVNNNSKWDVPEIDSTYRQIETELDQAKRKSLAQQLQRILLTEAVIWPLVNQSMVWGTQRYVIGNVAGNINVSSRLKLERLWIDPSLR